jgi:hypothetical protein
VTDPLVPADLNEPPWDRRVPATLLWTEPGERLRVPVVNADIEPHSLHVHGLSYGIDSDGSWPFGVTTALPRRFATTDRHRRPECGKHTALS